MSMTKEHGEEVKDEVAIVCCRTEKGTILSYENLEDPNIFPDLVDSGLLIIPDDSLKVSQVIGAKLLKTIDSLTPLTKDILEGIKESNENSLKDDNFKAVLKVHKRKGEIIDKKDLENPMYFDQLEDSLLIKLDDSVLSSKDVIGKKLLKDSETLTPITKNMIEGFREEAFKEPNKINKSNKSNEAPSILKIKIAEGKGIDIEIPINNSFFNENPLPKENIIKKEVNKNIKETINESKIIRELTKKHFLIEEVKFGEETKIDGKTLYIRNNICDDAVKINDLVHDIKIEIITPDKYNTYSNTIMDVQPIATKENGSELGSGVTRIIDGVIVMVTGTDECGVQIGEFGSSEGILEENIIWNRPGCPDKGDIFIKTNVVIAKGTNMERPGPIAAHTATDFITEEIRQALKKADESLIINTEHLKEYRRPNKKKVVLVKEIMGQGAMHDNIILPIEPVGVLGGKPNVDIGNVPIMLSPLEVLDGGIHALTCIGPASKECSRHYFREPLIIQAMNDENIDLAGVIFVGSPQINAEKFYVSKRLGMIVEFMDVDGAIVTTEGFGNNHIDFASHIEQIGMRGIPCVGMSFCANQGALVVGNKYMKYMVDNNKSEQGIENEILGCNALCKEDAIRALEMLKSAMENEDVKKAERKWNPNIKENNLEDIENAYGIKIERVLNETSIPISEKRKEKYS